MLTKSDWQQMKRLQELVPDLMERRKYIARAQAESALRAKPLYHTLWEIIEELRSPRSGFQLGDRVEFQTPYGTCLRGKILKIAGPENCSYQIGYYREDAGLRGIETMWVPERDVFRVVR